MVLLLIVNFHLGVVPAAVSALRRWRLDGQESQASLGYMERCLELTAFFFFKSQFSISHLCNLNGASIHRFGPWACWNELKDSVLMSGVKSLASSSLPGGQTPTGRFL